MPLGALGMLVLPVPTVVETNSSSAPGPADGVRMTLVSVVASMVSIVAARWLASGCTRAVAQGRTRFRGIACLVALRASSTVSSVGDRLSSVADRLTALIERA